MLSLCLQLEGAKTVAHCTCGVIMTIMVIHYGRYCFSGCGHMDAYKSRGFHDSIYGVQCSYDLFCLGGFNPSNWKWVEL